MNSAIIPFLKAVLEASWQGSLVILLILAVRPFLGARVPARWRYLLWTFVLIRLLIPAFMLPPSPASLQNISAVQQPIERAQASLDSNYAGYLIAGQMSTGQPAIAKPAAQSDPLPSRPATPPQHMPWWQISAIIWLSGAALFAAWIIGATIRLRRRLRREDGSVTPSVVRIWESCCARASMRHTPRLLATAWVESPALVGVVRPTLLIPRQAQAIFSTEDWEHIFMHELAHFSRRDHWTQALQLIALCVHWFNPLVWIGFRFLRADRELATDELALRRLAGDRAAAYGGTLLKVLSGRSIGGLQPGMVGIMEDGAQLKQRLSRIMVFGPRRAIGSAVGVAVIVAFAAAVLGRQEDKPDMSAYGAMKPVDILFAASATGDLPAVRKVLDDGLDINSASGKPGDNKTALVVAAGADQLQTVRLLVEKGAQLNPQKTGPSPALVAALQNGSLDCADYLMAKGAASDPLMQAAARGDKADIDKSLASGPSDFDKLKPLCEIAAVNGHQEIFAELYDAIRLLPDYSYWTASNGVAVKAIAHGHREIIEEMIKRDHNLARETSTRYAAAAAKTSGMREWLISKGFKVPEYTDNERLIDAADKGDLIQMQRLIKAGADVNYTGEGGWTPLTRAASSSRPGAVKLLLANKANPNSVKSPGWNYSALCMAKTTEIADMLYAAGANINAKLYGRDVPIISYVVSIGPNEMVQWFIDHGVDVAKSKGDGPISPTLLFEAGTPEIAGMLLDHGVDINFKDEEGMTAMFRIEQLVPHPSKIVQVLLDHGADPNMRAVDGYTPLMAARDGATVDVLIAAGADPKAKDDRGITAIGRYAPGADSTRLPALRRHSAIPDAKDNASMLRNAIMTHKTAEVQALLAAGADPNMQVGDTTISMLDTAIDFGQFQIADLLRKAGAKGAGLFSEAAAKGDLAQMKTLLDAGADVNENGPNAQTPLSFAVRRGQTASIQFLLDHGANPSLFDAYGMTPLQSATMASYNFQPSPDWSPIEGMTGKEAKKALTDILALLNKHKPDSNYRNPDGETALCRAAEAGDSIAFDLPTAGVNFNAQRNDGMTPLMMAIVTQPKNESLNGNGSIITTDPKTGAEQHFSGRGMIVKSLLAAGADLTLRNKAGKTALDLARENGNPEILALLQQSKTNHP